MAAQAATGARDDDGAAARALEQALARCYGHLARSEHSVAEMRARLRRAGVDAAVAAQALAILAEQGYLDDARYARMLVEDRRERWGAERIRARLQAAGIDRELIDAALTPLGGRASELDGATALLARRCREGVRDDRDRRRALGILVRAGYEAEVAYEAIHALERGAR